MPGTPGPVVESYFDKGSKSSLAVPTWPEDQLPVWLGSRWDSRAQPGSQLTLIGLNCAATQAKLGLTL